jgi:hypothetical protein
MINIDYGGVSYGIQELEGKAVIRAGTESIKIPVEALQLLLESLIGTGAIDTIPAFPTPTPVALPL